MSENAAPRGHSSNPFDEPIHEGHMVRLLAPLHPTTYYDQRSGHYYPSFEDPTTGEWVADVWPWDVPALLANDPPYRLRQPATAPAPAADAPAPVDVAGPAKGRGR